MEWVWSGAEHLIYWSKQCSEVVFGPSLEKFKARLDGSLSNLAEDVPAYCRRKWRRYSLKVPSELNHVMLWVCALLNMVFRDIPSLSLPDFNLQNSDGLQWLSIYIVWIIYSFFLTATPKLIKGEILKKISLKRP